MADDTHTGGKPGDSITQEALHAAIEKARLEERTKLRLELEKEEKARKEAETKLTETTVKLTDLTSTVEALQKAKASDGTVDVQKLVAEVTEKVAKTYDATLGEQVKVLKTELGSLRLERLRERLVQEAGGPEKLVLALVSGNTEDELKQSVVKAKAAYEEIAARIGASSGTGKAGKEDDGESDGDDNDSNENGSDIPPELRGSAGGNAAGGSGTGKGREASLLGQVRTMNPKDYAANREKVLEQLRKKYPGSQNVLVR